MSAMPFRSALPCGERRTFSSSHSLVYLFRSALPCGERHRISRRPQAAQAFRSALPCGERLVQVGSGAGRAVSIRAPVWGATYKMLGASAAETFRSALPCGERLTRAGLTGRVPCFDPRSRVGSDSSWFAGAFRDALFRSALPCGERPVLGSPMRGVAPLFRSALPCGERHLVGYPVPVYQVSIRAPVWGATASASRSTSVLMSFDPRSRVGSDPYSVSIPWPSRCFDPRSRVGSDYTIGFNSFQCFLFRSALPCGERPACKTSS